MFRATWMLVAFVASLGFALWTIQYIARALNADDPGWATSMGDLLSVLLAVFLKVLLYAVIAAVVIGAIALLLSIPRIRARRRRVYNAYRIHLTNADEAKPQDREDMMEAIANTVRAFPIERLVEGQRTVGFDFHFGEAEHGGMEWSAYLLCEEQDVEALDGVIAGAFLNVRIGRTFGGEIQPTDYQEWPDPGWILRLKKNRSFVYSISEREEITDFGTRLASPPIEAVALSQVSVGDTSSVRILLTPCSTVMERWARHRYRRHENKLARSENFLLDEAGLRSQLSRKEMIDSALVQNRSFFFFDIQVAARDRRTCYDIAGVFAGRRGENKLQPRLMFLRQGLYRERFFSGMGPICPAPSFRSLASASEIAYLVDFPTGRMKAVPLRRVVIPRLPAPPEILRAPRNAPIAAPPATHQPPPTDESAVLGPRDPEPYIGVTGPVQEDLLADKRGAAGSAPLLDDDYLSGSLADEVGPESLEVVDAELMDGSS